MTAAGVLAAPAGAERDRAIDDWCAAAWESFRDCRAVIVELLQRHRP